MRDHGGNLDAAIAEFGGTSADWLDLSTGINPLPYPLPQLSNSAWSDLPTKSAQRRLLRAAQSAFRSSWACLPTAGAQAGIQMLPRVLKTGSARVLTPTYNEHAANLVAAGWDVTSVDTLQDLAGADLAVVVNPNNPTGDLYAADALRALSQSVGHLLIDESFCDPHPEASVLRADQPPNLTVLRSFGKFYGLAGVRLGFVFGPSQIVAKLNELSGPWPVSGPAIEIGCTALADRAWQSATIARLVRDTARMDDLARTAGWRVAGGTTLFRLYEVDDAAKTQNQLARHRIWSRIFPYSDRWIRLGLPNGEDRWDQLAAALAG